MNVRRLSSLILWLFWLAALPSCSRGYPPPPETTFGEVTDTIHGVSIPDPYRWLEDQESPETRAWIEAQNSHAERIVGETPLRERLRVRFTELMRVPEIGSPRKGGEHEYFTMRRADQELAAMYRRPAPPEGEMVRIDPDADYELVVDPHPMSPDQTTSVEIQSVSPDGKLLIYSVRDGGRDEIEIRVRNLAEGADLPDRLPAALYSSVAFNHAGTGFYYSRRSRETGARIYFHELGADPASDREIFGEGYDPRSFVNVIEAGEGRYLLFTVQHGWSRSEIHLQDLESSAPVRPIVAGADGRFYPKFHEGVLYVRTNLDAPRNRILAIDLARPSRENWREVVPEGEDVIDDFSIIDGKLYVTFLDDVSSRVRVYGLGGTPAGEIPVPDHHRAEIAGAAKGKALLTISSFTQPPITYVVDLRTGDREIWQEPWIDFDAEGIAVEQVWYPSRDGTRVPMYLVHHEKLAKDGENPTLLHGYGGFYAAQKPGFDTMAAVWIEEGGVFALANIRGGSEFGEEWHRAGMLENKQNVFDDFIGAAEWLIENRYTNPERLAIRGASNGGLLVASVMTQRPELFRAVLCGFPDLDMFRFYTFTDTNNLPALHEYGAASIPEQFEFLRKYSPYQAVKDGTAYPAVMITSGDLDTRVPPLQARKMAARLQRATSSGLPVILRYHSKAGHAAERGLPLSRNIEDRAMETTFLLAQLGAGES